MKKKQHPTVRLASATRQVSRLRRSGLLAAACLPLLPLTGCAPGTPLVLAGHPWPGYEPLFLARNLGYLPEDLHLLEAPTLKASLQTLKEGRADGAMLTLDEVLQLRDRGLALQVVLVFDVSKGADMLLAQPRIATPGQLRGQRIGVEDSALGALLLALVLERAGLSLQDIRRVHIAYEDHEAAWARGDVDALVSYEPVAGRLKARGARQLLSTRDLPDTIFDVLAVRPQAAQRHAATLRAALVGHFQALTYLRQNPWDAAYRLAPHLGVSAEEMIASLRGLEFPDLVGNQRYLSGQDSQLLRITDKLSAIMLQAGLIESPVDAHGLYSAAYLPKEVS